MEANTYEMSLEEARRRGITRSHHPHSQSSEESNILSIIAKCHDGHQALLLNEEAKIQTSVKEWAEEFLAAFRERELKRNRTRILELNHFLDCMKREEDELDVYPLQNFEEDEL